MGRLLDRKREENGGVTKFGKFVGKVVNGVAGGFKDQAESISNGVDQLLSDPAEFVREINRNPHALLGTVVGNLPYGGEAFGVLIGVFLRDPYYSRLPPDSPEWDPIMLKFAQDNYITWDGVQWKGTSVKETADDILDAYDDRFGNRFRGDPDVQTPGYIPAEQDPSSSSGTLNAFRSICSG